MTFQDYIKTLDKNLDKRHLTMDFEIKYHKEKSSNDYLQEIIQKVNDK